MIASPSLTFEDAAPPASLASRRRRPCRRDAANGKTNGKASGKFPTFPSFRRKKRRFGKKANFFRENRFKKAQNVCVDGADKVK